MYYLNKNLQLSKDDLNFLNSLPDNLPDNKLTRKQIDEVSRLYYKYIGKNIDNQDWSIDLDDLEKKENWPSGPRVKTHEAQRIVLGFLIGLKPKLTNKEAAQYFSGLVYSRDSFVRLNRYTYKEKK